jgi:drug efflux transport system permease protein
MRRIVFMMWKELAELRHNPRLFPVIILAPLVQLTFLGYAATTDVKDVPVLVVDSDQTSASRALIARFAASPNFSINQVTTDDGQIDDALERGRVWMALVIPAGYGEELASGGQAVLQVIADGTDANSTNVALGYATNLVAGYAQELIAARPVPAGFAPGGIEPRIRIWFNPRLESRYFMLPGVVALLLLVVTANLSSMAIVREKEVGTLEQLNVTPLGRLELIVGKLLPYGAIGMIDVLLVLAVTVFWFEVPLRGSVLLLLAMSAVYLMTTLGLGLFVSTVSDTQQQAMMTTVFFFLIPMIYLSGFVFPIENMPTAIQPLTYLIPLRYFIVILRGIFLKGVGLETFWRDALALFGWGVAILALAMLRSRKRSN